jgi:hypothetical protein
MDTNTEKWLMFKNYIHNELGISNEQIREWVKEAVESQVNKMLSQEFEKFSLESYIIRALKTNYIHKGLNANAYDDFKRDVTDKVATMLYKNIVIKDKE